MSYQFDFIEWEITTACNAACPQCPRNYYGGETWKNLPIIQIDLVWAKKHLPEYVIKSLRRIDFCGTYGDPILNNNLLEIVKWLLAVNPNLEVTIKTNGGIRSVDWWAELARALGPHGGVFFGIDGLADTNHLYRRRTDFNTIIRNAQAFIQAGGQAYWNFIVFKHNEHQIDQARSLSKQLGFKEFNLKLTSRFFNKQHEMSKSVTVVDENGNPEYQLELPDNPKYINQSYQKFKIFNNIEYKIDCTMKHQKRIYLSAEGLVFPCGWWHDRMYGYEAEQHPDHEKLNHLFELAGGRNAANINYTPIDQIVNGPWFEIINNSWIDPEIRLNRCEVICGQPFHLIKDQNKLVNRF